MPGETEFDTESALSDISSGLGFDTTNGEGADNDVDLDVASSANADPSPAVGGSGDGQPAGTPATPAALEPDAALATPPGTWRKEAAAVWANLDPVARAEILKREQDIFQGLEGYKTDAQLGKSLQSVLQPYNQLFQQVGLNPLQAVAGLLRTHHALATGTPEAKQQLMQRLLQDYGVELASPGEAPYVAPEVTALQKEIQSLQSRLDNQDRQRLETVKQSSAKEVEAFAANPANVYFDELANDIAQLLASKAASNLKEAYEKAIWLNPAVRTKHLAELDKQAKAKAETERLNRLKAAKAAQAANVRVSSKSGSGTAPTGSMDDTLQQTLAEIQSRGT